MSRTIILGASRGLGAELVREAPRDQFLTGFGRKSERLEGLRRDHPAFEFHVADFSNAASQDEVLKLISETDFDRLFYVAGGGPFGLFGERDWKDHEWAWQVSFVFAARVAHQILRSNDRPQVILVGSSIAESKADPLAASYAAAKHALVGLHSSLRAENPDWDVRLFSPGYMDTEMLPRHAAVRKLGVHDPKIVAREIWAWSFAADKGGHSVQPPHPSC